MCPSRAAPLGPPAWTLQSVSDEAFAESPGVTPWDEGPVETDAWSTRPLSEGQERVAYFETAL